MGATTAVPCLITMARPGLCHIEAEELRDIQQAEKPSLLWSEGVVGGGQVGRLDGAAMRRDLGD